ncbi:ABC transporter permease [Marinigracilibium pacificum]|uniref:ABC transporter permease n=1 Tax=Marinigracilibium pacificum TaxID=2729599 RepID=A0A848J652_9BACT|nr:ABC transporter permease [Marinigracilibium pacificum]NMM50718.1 ABC transporter permease [Marinigracilibium pacificum]
MTDKFNLHHTPYYYAFLNLKSNGLAMFGVVIIFIAVMITLLGYLIIPDNTPQTNQGSPQIKKQLPFFTVDLLNVHKNHEVEKVGFFKSIYYGQESEYRIVPLQEYRIEGNEIVISPFGDSMQESRYSLIDVIAPVYIGDSDKLPGESNVDYSTDPIKYVDLNNEVHEISRAEVLDKIENELIESRTYWLGTDASGRDMLSRLLYGTRISLGIGFLAVLISLTLGVFLGAVAGYFGGKVDSFIVWLFSVIWSIPGIMLVIAISMGLQNKGVMVAFLAVGLTMWVEVARVVRGQFKVLKEKQFVEAAKAFGYKNRRIIFKHILPNLVGSLVVLATSNFAAAIILEAGLSFLGLSVQPPTPSWGIMISEGFDSIGTPNSWHMIVLPGIAISLLVLAFNLLGNGLRDALDPKALLK